MVVCDDGEAGGGDEGGGIRSGVRGGDTVMVRSAGGRNVRGVLVVAMTAVMVLKAVIRVELAIVPDLLRSRNHSTVHIATPQILKGITMSLVTCTDFFKSNTSSLW